MKDRKIYEKAAPGFCYNDRRNAGCVGDAIYWGEREIAAMPNITENIITAIDYMEDHLFDGPDLGTVADAVHYSKYHLHRMFVNEVGITLHDYIQRRQLTEAAKLLVYSERPIMEIALFAGYGSQQAFTSAFKEMYKKTPARYREEAVFYPLQLRYVLNQNPVQRARPVSWGQRIACATVQDVPGCMELARLAVDGFPCLDEALYAKRLRESIDRKEALILRDADTVTGLMAFCRGSGSIDFLGVHPQYRHQGIEAAFIQKIAEETANTGTKVTVTTFREGDKADTGYRKLFKELGFVEAEPLMEFGYPTQRFILQKEGCGINGETYTNAGKSAGPGF